MTVDPIIEWMMQDTGSGQRPGRLALLAKELGVSKSAIYQWETTPINRVLEVERITGIPREKLRPDFFKAAKEQN